MKNLKIVRKQRYFALLGMTGLAGPVSISLPDLFNSFFFQISCILKIMANLMVAFENLL